MGKRIAERSCPMQLQNFLRRLIGKKPRRRAPARSCVPCLMLLEDRTLPSTFTVLNLADHGSGSLRDAIVAANQNPGADVIQFQAGLTGTIALTSGPLSITDSVSIVGPGAARLAIDGSGAGRVLSISGAGNTVGIAGLSITGGLATR